MNFMIPRSLKTLLRLHAQFLDVRHSRMILSADHCIRHLEISFPRTDRRGVLAVILSAAKDLTRLPKRSFAALRMTGLISTCLPFSTTGLDTRRVLEYNEQAPQGSIVSIQVAP